MIDYTKVTVAKPEDMKDINDNAMTDNSIIQVMPPMDSYIESNHMNPIPDSIPYITKVSDSDESSMHYLYPTITIIAKDDSYDSLAKIPQATAFLEYAGWDVTAWSTITREEADKMFGELLSDDNIYTIPQSVKNMMDDLRKQKINESDAVYVINTDGIVDEDMQREIDFAIEHNIDVYYMYPNEIISVDELADSIAEENDENTEE